MTKDQFLNILTAEVITINGNIVHNISHAVHYAKLGTYIHITYENEHDEFFALIDVEELKHVPIPTTMDNEISIVVNTNTDDPSTLIFAAHMLHPMPIQDLFN